MKVHAHDFQYVSEQVDRRLCHRSISLHGRKWRLLLRTIFPNYSRTRENEYCPRLKGINKCIRINVLQKKYLKIICRTAQMIGRQWMQIWPGWRDNCCKNAFINSYEVGQMTYFKYLHKPACGALYLITTIQITCSALLCICMYVYVYQGSLQGYTVYGIPSARCMHGMRACLRISEAYLCWSAPK